MKLKRILHPTDYSDYSLPAMKDAFVLSKDYGAELILLHVVLCDGADKLRIDGSSSGEKAVLDRQDIFEEMRRLVSTGSQIQVKHVLRNQDPVDAIFRVQSESRCDLIVLSTHETNGMSPWFSTSLAEQIIQGAPCAVFVVKERRTFSGVEDRDASEEVPRIFEASGGTASHAG